MSDEEVKAIILAQLESDLVARGVKPYPGSIVDYCPMCRVPVRLSPKSQKSIKNRGATFVCPLCMETKVIPKISAGGDTMSFQATNHEDLKRFTDMAERAGHAALPLGEWEAPTCEPCENGSHQACFGQGCGCRPCQTGGPVRGL